MSIEATAPTGAPAPTATPATPSTFGKLGDNPKFAQKLLEKAREKGSTRRQNAIEKSTRGGKSPAPAAAAATTPERGEDGKFKPREDAAAVEEKKPEAAAPAEAKATEPAASVAEPAAPVAEPAASVAEPAAPAEPKPTAKDFVRLRKERERAKEIQAAAAKERAEAAAEAERVRAEKQRMQAEAEADAKLKVEDPFAWARKHGLDLRMIAKKTVAEAEGKPAAEKSPLEAKLEAMEAKLAEKEAKEEEAKQERQRQEAEQTRQQAIAHIQNVAAAEFSRTSEDDYPYLHAEERGDVAAAASQILQEYFAKTGKELPLAKVFALMESNARDHYEELDKRLAKARAKSALPAAAAVVPAQASGAVKTAKPEAETVEASSGPEVTSRDAAASAASEAPPKTPKERRESAKRMLAERLARRN